MLIPVPYRDALAAFRPFADDRTSVLLDGRAAGTPAPVSVIAADPFCTVTATRAGVFVNGQKTADDPFTALEKLWRVHRTKQPPDSLAPFAFTGGIAGYFGYELGGCLERLPAPRPDALDLPLMHVGFYDTVAVFDHAAGRAFVVSHADDEGVKARQLAERLAAAPATLPEIDWSQSGVWRPELDRATVERNIRRVIDYIEAGDIFQANYTQRFIARRPPGLGDFDIYRRLSEVNPAPYAAFLRCQDVSIASASPERFLRLDPHGRLSAEPIKGTRPRAADPARDAALALELRLSAKDRAENLMIVDLMRNDLGRVCETGSVRVPRLIALESFAAVHHLVSEVEGRLRPGLTPIDVLRATFPGGSVTGAPKIRAMQIIHELEAAPRGAYCGCYGWIGFDGAMDMSMTIRTLTLTPDILLAQAGGGIVADSDPAAEYEESMVKIAPLLRAVTGQPHDDLAQRRIAG